MAFIKIDREMFNHWLWDEKPFSRAQAWIDLISLANHETKDFMQDGTLIHGQRGNVYRSKTWLAARWGWSRGKVDRFIKVLVKEQMLVENRVRVGTVNGTVLTIVNYGKFQDVRAVKRATNGPSTDRARTEHGHIQEPIRAYKEPIRNNMPSADPEDDITEEELQALYEQIRKENPEYV